MQQEDNGSRNNESVKYKAVSRRAGQKPQVRHTQYGDIRRNMHLSVDNERRDITFVSMDTMGNRMLGSGRALQWIYYLLDC